MVPLGGARDAFIFIFRLFTQILLSGRRLNKYVKKYIFVNVTAALRGFKINNNLICVFLEFATFLTCSEFYECSVFILNLH